MNLAPPFVMLFFGIERIARERPYILVFLTDNQMERHFS